MLVAAAQEVPPETCELSWGSPGGNSNSTEWSGERREGGRPFQVFCFLLAASYLISTICCTRKGRSNQSIFQVHFSQLWVSPTAKQQQSHHHPLGQNKRLHRNILVGTEPSGAVGFSARPRQRGCCCSFLISPLASLPRGPCWGWGFPSAHPVLTHSL